MFQMYEQILNVASVVLVLSIIKQPNMEEHLCLLNPGWAGLYLMKTANHCMWRVPNIKPHI